MTRQQNNPSADEGLAEAMVRDIGDEIWAKNQTGLLGYSDRRRPDEQTLVEIIVASIQYGRAITIDAAVTAARDALVNHEWPPQDGDKQCDKVLNAIRALAAARSHGGM